MSAPVISVENLGKKYRIKHQAERQRYVALRDVLADKTKGVAKRLWSAVRAFPLRLDRGEGQGEVSRPPSTEDFWALKDVSFEVKQGEVVGIIGRNGAGKSTLLKILSRITEPTTGRIHLRGRVASLLEVGTGFHPELTGRENVFLNGAILGMARQEIRQKFDEIVAFSEVEKFLDTPVKRYSSGMYVRLAFAVAAHLEPEILIVDEVLAVGDTEFQRKCLGKIESVSRSGRTVLFVSHNMAAVQSLCSRAVVLEQGRLLSQGATNHQVLLYLTQGQTEASVACVQLSVDLKLSELSVTPQRFQPGATVILSFKLDSQFPQEIREFCIILESAHGQRIGIIDLREIDLIRKLNKATTYNVQIELVDLPLIEGDYFFGFYVVANDRSYLKPRVSSVTVLPQPVSTERYEVKHRGLISLKARAVVS